MFGDRIEEPSYAPGTSDGRSHDRSARAALWEVVTLGSADQLAASHLDALLGGRIAAVRIPGFVPADQCVLLLKRLREVGIGAYAGMKKALGTLWPNHWVPRYVTGDWDAYFEGAIGAEEQKRHLFEPIGDPRRLVNEPIRRALGEAITPLRCPSRGRAFHAMIVRAGAAELHFDWAGFDLMPEVAKRVTAQMAWNIYLSNPGRGGELEVFQRQGTSPGLTKGEAASQGADVVFGNYGFPASVVSGARAVSIPVEQGDLVLVMNRHFHRVAAITPNELTNERVAISAHIVRLDDGTLHDFS